MSDNFKLARERLRVIASVIGEFVGGLIAVLFYWTVFVLFAGIARMGADPLHRQPTNERHWLPREAVSTALDRAKRQG